MSNKREDDVKMKKKRGYINKTRGYEKMKKNNTRPNEKKGYTKQYSGKEQERSGNCLWRVRSESKWRDE